MKSVFRISQVIAVALLSLAVVGCDNSAPNPVATSSSDYKYRVNPALTNEQSKRVPELLIVNENAECLHYSTGYAAGFFNEALDTLFNQVRNPVGQPFISDEIRADFIARHPEEVAQVENSVKNLPDDVREMSFKRVIDDAITQELNAQQSRKPFTYCDQNLDEHLSWIVDANGNPVTREQVLVPRIVTVLQYRNDDCEDCLAQQRDIDDYISSRHLFVNYVFIERKSQTIQ